MLDLHTRRHVLGFIVFALGSIGSAYATDDAKPLIFEVSFPKETLAEPFSGRVVVFLAKPGGRGEPRNGPNWFSPQPMFAADFANIAPGTPMRIDTSTSIAFPPRPETPASGTWQVQAVIDRNLGGRTIGGSPGNLYSDPQTLELTGDSGAVVSLVCDRVVEERAFNESARVKELRVESKLLSKFYGRKTTLNASIALPEEWEKEPDRKFPVFYSIPGFGGTHYSGGGRGEPRGTNRDGVPFVFVTLDPSCPGGHSVFADSANNGPWGEALVTEFIPECEKRFRGAGQPSARYVGGHSSGGWSSLWLQVAYPDVFGGCWSTSPDPVDFRDFQRIDLYSEGMNLFVDPDGKPRPIARDRSGETRITMRSFSNMERPIRGEQMGSFEYVFSPRGENGLPRPLWDRDTGAIDRTTAEAWRPYDISLKLRTQWKELEPKLGGKIHVYMGTEDTFFLEGAVKLMKRDLEAIGANAVVELFPGDHGSVMTPELRNRIDKEIAETYRKTLQK